MAWLRKGGALLLVLGVLICATSDEGQSASGQGPPGRVIVFAHYMHCYILGAMPDSDAQQGRAAAEVVQDPRAWPTSETIERSWWSSRLAPLAAAGRAGVEADFALAEAAGLDALGLLIGPHHLPKSAYAAGLRLAAAVASQNKVKLIPDLWDDWDTGHPPSHADFVRYGEAVKALMDEYPAGFLRYQGRPVISLGNPLRNGADPGFSWTDYKAVFEPWGGSQAVYILLNARPRPEEVAADWGNAADAFSLWAATQGWNDPQNDVLPDLARRYRKAIAWPVSTSYYGGRRGTESMSESLGVSRFTDQWRRAMASTASFVEVQTWNDLSEDHAITETNYRGTSLIDLNRYFSDWVHRGRRPKIGNDKIYLFHHRQLVDAHLSEATILAHNDAWHVTPSTDYIDLVTMLQRAGRLRVQNGSEQLSRDVPAGFHEWLIYAPSRRRSPGPSREAYVRPNVSYPADSVERSVTGTDEISAGFVTATLLRDGRAITTVRSRIPIAASGRWQDLSMVGNVGTAD